MGHGNQYLQVNLRPLSFRFHLPHWVSTTCCSLYSVPKIRKSKINLLKNQSRNLNILKFGLQLSEISLINFLLIKFIAIQEREKVAGRRATKYLNTRTIILKTPYGLHVLKVDELSLNKIKRYKQQHSKIELIPNFLTN